jgi:DNA polymerase-4
MTTPARDHCVVHLDTDAFFASVEQRDDPKLRGRPVAVGTGVVASCSYESRKFGVRTGMRLGEARRLCRPLIVVPGEYPRYEQAARHILAICTERTPQVEVAALDDLYLDLSRHDAVDHLAGDLQAQVRDEVHLSVSLGIASNKLVANVATKQAKPGRKIRVSAGEERGFLAPWPVHVLHGVGPKVDARLQRLNVRRVAEMAEMPVPILRGLFGARGRILHDQAQGIDPRPVQPCKPPQSVSRRSSFDPPVADRAFLHAMLDYLLERAAAWMRFHHLAARRLTLTLRYGDYECASGTCPLREPVQDEFVLKGHARDRFETLYERRLPLRLLGIELAPLVLPEQQISLFRDADDERAAKLTACKDAIHQRFGFTALLTGSTLLVAERLERDRDNFRMRTPCLTR